MKFRKTHRQDGPLFYKDEINHVYGLELDTESDRDTAAKMIEAMAWLDQWELIDVWIKPDGRVHVWVRKIGSRSAEGVGEVLLDAILAAKKESEG